MVLLKTAIKILEEFPEKKIVSSGYFYDKFNIHTNAGQEILPILVKFGFLQEVKTSARGTFYKLIRRPESFKKTEDGEK